jgi:DNA-binding response OmpR family regulator
MTDALPVAGDELDGEPWLSPWGSEVMPTGLLLMSEREAALALSSALRRSGMQAMVASDLSHAQRIASEVLPDFVVCDVQAEPTAWPWLSGLLDQRVTSELVGLSQLRCCVALVGTMDPPVQGLKNHARLHLMSKPVSAAALVAEVAEAIYVERQCSDGEAPLLSSMVRPGPEPIADNFPDLMLLAPTERKMFMALAAASPRVVRREGLREAVWPGEPVSERVVDQYVKRLRVRLRQLGSSLVVSTVRGHGYRLESTREPVTQVSHGRRTLA